MTDTLRKQAERPWKEGDKLTWCGERFMFLCFDPVYPRAMSRSEADGRVVAIDITTAKRVSASVIRKQAERQRRVDEGQVRVEVWLSEAERDTIREMAQEANVTPSVVISQLLKYYHS